MTIIRLKYRNFSTKIKSLKFLLWIFMIVTLGITAFQYELLLYAARQAKGQMKVIINARDIEDVINDSLVNDDVRSKLKLIKEIMTFGEMVGLKKTKNYQTYYEQNGQAILWNVSASKPYMLQAYEWDFPFLGRLGYKGFFQLELAEKEAEKIKILGYDVMIRPVSAWSTLGFLSDPILSEMLKRSEGELAELIFHELTHATIFLKNNLELNENLASFVGKKLAIQYLTNKYGNESNELIEFYQQDQDYTLFVNHILHGKDLLDSLYNTYEFQSLDNSQKETVKKSTIVSIINELDLLPFHFPENYRERLISDKINNAFFLSYQRYYDRQDELDSIYEAQVRNLAQFFSFFDRYELFYYDIVKY